MAPTQAPLKVVTVQTGHRYPDLWVSRLAAMVARQLGEPHRFIVYTDRPEPGRFGEPIASHQQLVQQDLETGSLRAISANCACLIRPSRAAIPSCFSTPHW